MFDEKVVQIVRKALLVAALPLVACGRHVSHENSLRLAGIAPGDSESSVVSALGSPEDVLGGSGSFSRFLRYEKLLIALDEDERVVEIETTNPRHCFDGWVCPGMPLAQVSKKLSNSRLATASQSPLIVHEDGEGCWLEAEHRDGTITMLVVRCQP